ncbi:MAG: hypothetical protein ACI9I0_001497 [Rhodoferax sp.]|jgi:hypothetical protein
MRYLFLITVLAATALFTACSPTFNWRDVRLEQTSLAALLPCKPDQRVRVQTLGGTEVSITMLGCEAGGALFTLAYADLKDPTLIGPVLAQWKVTSLSNLRATASTESPFVPRGARDLPQSVKLQVQGLRPDDSAVVLQSVWFASGSLVFQAAVYADSAKPMATETFFSGLQLP